jgi:hypothetical protein
MVDFIIHLSRRGLCWPSDAYYSPCIIANISNDCPDFEAWADHINDKSQTS